MRKARQRLILLLGSGFGVALIACGWAGKRMCGAIGDGGMPYNDFTNLGGHWYFTCTGGQGTAQKYPYGNAFDGSVCVWNASASLPVASTRCVGGAPNVHDMSGNAREWEDACEANADPAEDQSCQMRGGAYSNDTPSDLECAANYTKKRNSTSAENGVRCCYP